MPTTDINNNRARGVIVYKLHTPELEPYGDRYAFGYNPNTYAMFLIHDPEGVGYRIAHEKPFRFMDFSFNAQWFTPKELLDMVNWEDSIDLADLIRSFGARLESNFYQMHYALTTLEVRDPDKYHTEYDKQLLTFYAKQNPEFERIFNNE